MLSQQSWPNSILKVRLLALTVSLRFSYHKDGTVRQLTRLWRPSQSMSTEFSALLKISIPH